MRLAIVQRGPKWFFSAVSMLLLLLASSEARAGLYPTPSEARVAYEWLHAQVEGYMTSSAPRWAIDDLDGVPKSLPPGVLAEYDLGAGWATFGLALAAGQAVNGLTVGSLPTQTDVKVRWPDGSIRFAVVTAEIGSQGVFAIRSGSGSSGSFSPQIPGSTRVVLDIGGTSYSADLPAAPSSDLWLSGPLVSEWRSVVVPKNTSNVPHPFLRVVFDYRAYYDGSGRLDVTVENVLDTQGATVETYDVQILISGQSVFQKSAVSHWYLTRWRKVFGVGLVESTIDPDFEPFHRASALPRYLSSVVDQTPSTTGPHYEILGRGANTYTAMGAAGGRAELGPYPDGVARFVVHGSGHWEWVLRNGDLAGSWPVHVLETDGSLVSIDDRPDFWLDTRGTDKPAGNLGACGPLIPDIAHQPSWAYVPYLVSGDRYYADEMAHWANYVLLFQWPFPRNTSEGLLNGEQTRGFGWGLRNMADAAAYLPDSHAFKGYFVQKVLNNLAWADLFAAGSVYDYIHPEGSAPSPLGLQPHRLRGGAWDEWGDTVALWEHDFLAWSLDHTNQQGFPGGEDWLTALAGYHAKLFTSDGEGFPRDKGAPYEQIVRLPDTNGVLQWIPTFPELDAVNGQVNKYWWDEPSTARLALLIAARGSRTSKP